jgi:nicotinamide-nucleotide amidase
MDAELVALSAEVGRAALAARTRIATAESCTGGWAAQVITHIAGSSDWFDCGLVTYSNEAKIALLDVNTVTLQCFGAVSVETAAEMAAGAIQRSRAGLALSITGIAGPGGGSSGKPVGTVCFGWCVRGQSPTTDLQVFQGDREAVRRQAVIHALNGTIARLATLANSVP